VPPTSARPPDLVGRIFRGSTVLRSGRLTRGQLRSAAWQRLFPDVYACRTVPITHEMLVLAATRVLLPGAVACGRSAATLWDVPLAGDAAPVECVLPADRRGGDVPGVLVTRRSVSSAEVVERRGVQVTRPLRTALDLARIRPQEAAVIALDRFLAPGLVFVDEVRAAAAVLGGRDCRYVRVVTDLADGLAGSPQETRLRLLLHRSSLPRPVAQHRVRVEGRSVARVDFAWPEQRLAVEYEGLWHGERQQVARDRARLNALTRAGWRVVFVTAADLHDPPRLIARIAEALAAPRFA
jgi:very-short-patch-repair endonuclease